MILASTTAEKIEPHWTGKTMMHVHVGPKLHMTGGKPEGRHMEHSMMTVQNGPDNELLNPPRSISPL